MTTPLPTKDEVQRRALSARRPLMTRLARLLIATGLVIGGGAAAAKRTHALERIFGTSDTPTFELKRRPFVRRVVADGYLRAVKSTPLAAPLQSDGAQKIAWLAPDGSRVKQGDIVIRFDPTEFEKKLRDGETDRASAEAKIEKERVLAASAVRGRARTADLSTAELEKTRAFQATDPTIFSKNQIIESGIDEALLKARVSHAAQAKGIESTLSQSKVDLITVEKKKADLQITQARQSLQALEIRAPHDGIVVFESDWRGNLPHVGDSVFPGQTIARLPLLEEMEADVFVLEADAGGLAVGNVASVVLEAHPDPPYEAKIKRVDTLAKPRVREVPIQYFGATLELSRTVPELMKPGERIHATLVLDTKDALAVPRQCVFDKDGKTLVYRLASDAKRFEPVPVQLGASSLGLVAIEEGLADGDRIALRDPTLPAEAASSSPAGDGQPDPTKTSPLGGGGAK